MVTLDPDPAAYTAATGRRLELLLDFLVARSRGLGAHLLVPGGRCCAKDAAVRESLQELVRGVEAAGLEPAPPCWGAPLPYSLAWATRAQRAARADTWPRRNTRPRSRGCWARVLTAGKAARDRIRWPATNPV